MDIVTMQKAADGHLERLHRLDFSNEELIIGWLAALQYFTETEGLTIDKEKILCVFAKHGYLPRQQKGKPTRKLMRAEHVIVTALHLLQRDGVLSYWWKYDALRYLADLQQAQIA